MCFKIMGIKTAVSKKTGQTSSVLFLSVPFTEYEKENSILCAGEAVTTEWTTLDVSELKPGMLVTLFYTKTATGKAILSGFHVVKQSATTSN